MSEERGFKTTDMLLAFVIGGVVGAGVALLMAPQSGKETREKIKELAGDAKDKASDYFGQAREKVTSAVSHGKEFVDEKKSLIASAIDAGKEAYEKEKGRLSK
ncbi:MAG: YtxH domain-containing protein [Nitrospirae bacterium]|nr:YtxH domain-containing protein [Nitrospirota bacterium]